MARHAQITEESIRAVVDAFYGKIQADPVLGPVFGRFVEDWGPHLQKMYDFWSSVLLGTGRFKGSPMFAHMKIDDLQPQMFTHWLALFEETCDEVMEQDAATAMITVARRMGANLANGTLEERPDWAPPLKAE